jgi:hypothetical protein
MVHPLAPAPVLALPHVLVRTVHVLSAAVVGGGGALVWAALTVAGRRSTALEVAIAYEWLFWGAAGVLVATGVGNLGALAPTLPGDGWGRLLSWKLVAVLVGLVGSFARTRLLRDRVAEAAGGGGSREREGGRDALRYAYALTAVGFALVAGLAVVLAHG